MFKVFGRVTNATDDPVKDAIVIIAELDLRATTDISGRYALGLVPQGRHTLRVKPGWKGSKLKSKDLTIDVSASAEPIDVKLVE